VCEVHGEVSNDQIVMGYQYAKDQYAVVDPEETDKLRSDADRSINVDRFVDPATIDPTYFAGKTYYLTPNGRAGEKPYALLNRAMTEEHVVGLAQVVILNREQLVVLRAIGKLLAISALQYVDNVRGPEEFETLLPESEVSSQELKLAKTLIAATQAEEPDLDEYRDLYNERLKELVEAKVEGHEVSSPPKQAAPPVINLMDALRASLQKRAARAPKKVARKPAKKAAARKRKTG
jgi:DNA end-binding protein Ku